jgi:hypothetical protein
MSETSPIEGPQFDNYTLLAYANSLQAFLGKGYINPALENIINRLNNKEVLSIEEHDWLLQLGQEINPEIKINA